jgi:holin-like protein
MLLSLGLILLCQLVGEAIARGTDIPVPGPVIGLALCVLLLLARDALIRWMPAELRDGTFEATGRGILSHLSLLFIPAGVGVVQRLDVLGSNALAIAVSVVASTALGMAVTAWVFSIVARWTHE